jgi:thermostable 8-oxoguanine DNA glycosylase
MISLAPKVGALAQRQASAFKLCILVANTTARSTVMIPRNIGKSGKFLRPRRLPEVTRLRVSARAEWMMNRTPCHRLATGFN